MIVELLNNLDVVGHLNGWRRVQAVEVRHQVGAWVFEAPLNDSNKGLLTEWGTGDLPGLSIWDESTGWRYAGLLTELDIDDIAIEGPTWVASGVDFNQLLVDRLARPHATESEWWRYATDTAAGDTVSVAENFLQLDAFYGLDAQRVTPWSSSVFANGSPLPATTAKPQGAECLRLIRELLEATGYYLARDFQPAFTPNPARLVWEIIPQPVSQTRFSARDGNIQRVSVKRKAAEVTEVIGVGEDIGAGPAREVRTASGFDATWQRRYREQLHNQPSMSGAEIQDYVDRVLANGGPKTIVTAVDPDASLWGPDLDVGWLADVAVPTLTGGYEYERLPVEQVTLTGEAGVWERRVEFGARDLNDTSRRVHELGQVKAAIEAVKRAVR